MDELSGAKQPKFAAAPVSCLVPASSLMLASCLMLTGCGLLSPPAGRYLPNPAAVQETWDCTPAAPGGGTRVGPPPSTMAPETIAPTDMRGSVPEGFVPVSAVLCTWEPMRENHPGATPGAAVAPVVREDLLGGNLARLLAALAEPSDRGGSGPCTADMEIVPDLWLVDASGWSVNVQWPTDACGKTRGKPDTHKAIAALTVVGTRLLPVPGQGR